MTSYTDFRGSSDFGDNIVTPAFNAVRNIAGAGLSLGSDFFRFLGDVNRNDPSLGPWLSGGIAAVAALVGGRMLSGITGSNFLKTISPLFAVGAALYYGNEAIKMGVPGQLVERFEAGSDGRSLATTIMRHIAELDEIPGIEVEPADYRALEAAARDSRDSVVAMAGESQRIFEEADAQIAAAQESLISKNLASLRGLNGINGHAGVSQILAQLQTASARQALLNDPRNSPVDPGLKDVIYRIGEWYGHRMMITDRLTRQTIMLSGGTPTAELLEDPEGLAVKRSATPAIT